MFLRKTNNTLNIDEYNDLSLRVQNLIKQLVNGEIIGQSIIATFNQANFENLLGYLNDNQIDYKLDESLVQINQELLNDAYKFETHAKNASEIKNNLNNSDKGYVEFLRMTEKKLARRLYEHQAKASYHMAYSLNSCNFSVPGAGKTSIVYAAYSYLKGINLVDRILIVGPLSSFYPWKNEYFECFGVEPDIINLSSFDREGKKKYLRRYETELCEVSFINYEGLIGLSKDISHFLKSSKCMVILDEAHRIKNPASKRSVSTLEFAEYATSRVVLTGTPIPNGYQDLLSLFDFIWPKREVVGFRLHELKRLSKSPSEFEVKELMSNIDPFYIRIKKEYLNLPVPIHNEPSIAKMGAVQKEIYDALISDFLRSSYSSSDEALIMELKKAKLIRLMQASTNPSSIDLTGEKWLSLNQAILSEKIKNYEMDEVPEKYKVVLRLLEDIQSNKKNKKAVIWTTFVKNILSLRNFLEDNGIFCELLYGEIDNDTRAEIIDRFHTDLSLKVIIANPAAVSESISLHKACHNAIYLDKNFNGAQFIQSKDRIHRVGLKKYDEVNYFYIFSEGSIDSIVHKRLLEKEQMMIDIIEGSIVPLFEPGFESDLSDSDVKYIEEYFRKVNQ